MSSIVHRPSSAELVTDFRGAVLGGFLGGHLRAGLSHELIEPRVDDLLPLGNLHLLALYQRTRDVRQGEQARRIEDLSARREKEAEEFRRVIEVRP